VAKAGASRRVRGAAVSLLRIAYRSEAVRHLSRSELEALESVSSRRNREANITGLLLAQDQNYYGILEGPEAVLLARMEVVVTDPRHCRLRILREEAAASRRFSGWKLIRLPSATASNDPVPVADFFVDFARRLA
jgi:hypothetical protein